jgi:hypothetical protein
MPSASSRTLLVAIVTIAGCAGDETDTGGIPLCTGAAYDTCSNEHECMSQDCRVVGTVQSCTQSCSASMPCPDLDGEPVTCNAGGLCEPTAARACRTP